MSRLPCLSCLSWGTPVTPNARNISSFQDYDTAKLLKEAETQLKSLGQQLAQLEVAKRQAVEDEDYDRAKMLKVRGYYEVPCPCPCNPPMYLVLSNPFGIHV